MPVTEILLLRHGHRLAWSLDPTTGKYTSTHPFPTKLPADPPLASHGVRQSEETGKYLSERLLPLAQKDQLRIYSSLFYRCLQTLKPTVQGLLDRLETLHHAQRDDIPSLKVRGERGVGEWFGYAWFKQPSPAPAGRLKKEFFPWLDDDYVSLLVPDGHGERIDEVHDRVARALGRIIRDVDREYDLVGRKEENVTLLICGHAAQIICSGRALTGRVPEDYDVEDFKCFTCGISRFVRRKISPNDPDQNDNHWRTNGGVAGGWDCVLNSDCSHLTDGEERGWHFHGDESFDSYAPGAAQGPAISDAGGFGSDSRDETGNAKL